MKKNILKSKGITGLSKMKATDLDPDLHGNFSEEELAIVATNWLQRGADTGTIQGNYQPPSKEESLIKWFFGRFSLKLPCH